MTIITETLIVIITDVLTIVIFFLMNFSRPNILMRVTKHYATLCAVKELSLKMLSYIFNLLRAWPFLIDSAIEHCYIFLI